MIRRILPQTQRQERCVLTALNHEDLKNELEDEEVYPMEGEAFVTSGALSA